MVRRPAAHVAPAAPETRTRPGASAESDLAAENERLRLELAARDLQQAATADVLRIIARHPTDVQEVLDAIASRASTLIRTRGVNIFTLDDDLLRARVYVRSGTKLPYDTRVISERLMTEVRGRPPVPGWIAGRAVLERRIVHVPDIRAAADELPESALNAQANGWLANLAVPLLRSGDAIGVMTLTRGEPEPFTPQEIALAQGFADQAVVAIENARLFAELQESNATLTEKTQQLTEALEQQTATADILRVIASSPGDLQRVLDTIAAAAARLCGPHAYGCRFWRLEGDRLHDAARAAAAPGYFADEVPPRALEPGWASAHAVWERRQVHLPDAQAADAEYPVSAADARKAGHRTLLLTPLLRHGAPIGVFSTGRTRVEPFTDAELRLMQSFADQAVIAIENARLFDELRERDERRRHELERAAAIQQRLLPSAIQGWPGVLEIAHRFRPAVETSGDFFDVLRLPPPWDGGLPPLQIAVGDVAGKGMAAALVTALARSALHASGSIPTDAVTPSGTLRVAGRRLHRDVGSGHFVACALGVVEPPGSHHAGPRLRLANAAQVPVLLVRAGETLELEPPGYRLPLGAQGDGDYRDVEADLRPGDVVVFSSDGLVEAPALSTASAPAHLAPPEKPGELYGFTRLAASASHWAAHAPTAEAIAAGIWSDLTAWCGDNSHHDDMTLLVLRVP